MSKARRFDIALHEEKIMLTQAQIIKMLRKLPAACAFDAVEDFDPPVCPLDARKVLVDLEAEGVVSWSDEGFALTPKGEGMLSRAQVRELQKG